MRAQSLLLAGKVTVTAGIGYLLIRTIDLRALWASLLRIDAASLGFAIGLILLQSCILGWRWHRIVHFLGAKLPVPTAFLWTSLGIFFNQALPSSIGGDAVRIWLLHRQNPGPGVAVGSVMVERVSGLVVLGLLVSASAAWIASERQSAEALTPMIAVGPALLVGVALMLTLGSLLTPALPTKFSKHAELLTSSFATVSRNLGSVLETFVAGAAASTVGLLAAYVIGRSLGIDANPLTYIALVGGSVLITVIPVSVGGWGLREASLVALFGSIGVGAEPVLAMSIAWGLLPVVTTLPFALFWWFSGRLIPPRG